jgi:hypothetical protein
MTLTEMTVGEDLYTVYILKHNFNVASGHMFDYSTSFIFTKVQMWTSEIPKVTCPNSTTLVSSCINHSLLSRRVAKSMHHFLPHPAELSLCRS